MSRPAVLLWFPDIDVFNVQLNILQVLSVDQSIDVVVTLHLQWIVPRVVGTRHSSIRLNERSARLTAYPAVTLYTKIEQRNVIAPIYCNAILYYKRKLFMYVCIYMNVCMYV